MVVEVVVDCDHNGGRRLPKWCSAVVEVVAVGGGWR